jgi:hypothetical protein
VALTPAPALIVAAMALLLEKVAMRGMKKSTYS